MTTNRVTGMTHTAIMINAARGENQVTILQAFEAVGWDDFWWGIGREYENLPNAFKMDLIRLAADYAEMVLPIFEKKYPNDGRPRAAIQSARDFADGKIEDASGAATWAAAEVTAEDAAWSAVWDAARTAARAAAWAAARDAARTAARAAARAAAWAAAWDASGTTARDAAWSAAREKQSKMLVSILEKWS